MRKLVNWWNKKPNSENEDEVVDIYHEEKEFRYETTLKRDLRELVDLLSYEFPHDKVESFREMNYSGKLTFMTESSYSIEHVYRMIPMKTLQVTATYSHGTYWEADHGEYKEKYLSKQSAYSKTVIKPLLKTVEDNFNDKAFYYIFCKYEDSIYIVLNTLKDILDHNGSISREVLKKSSEIIDRFKVAIDKKIEEIEYVEELQKEAVSKSLIGRLDSEIEFMDTFLEVDMSVYRQQVMEGINDGQRDEGSNQDI